MGIKMNEWLAGKSTMNEPMYLLMKMVIFHCHVSFQGGKSSNRRFFFNASQYLTG